MMQIIEKYFDRRLRQRRLRGEYRAHGARDHIACEEDQPRHCHPVLPDEDPTVSTWKATIPSPTFPVENEEEN